MRRNSPGENASLSQAARDCDGLFSGGRFGRSWGVWLPTDPGLAPSFAGLDDVLLPHINPRDKRDEDHNHDDCLDVGGGGGCDLMGAPEAARRQQKNRFQVNSKINRGSIWTG